MKKVILYGHLREKFGKTFHFRVKNPAEAVRALDATLPNFRATILKNEYYKIICGNEVLDLDEYKAHNPISDNVIRIIPVISGAGKTARLITGVALLAFTFYAPWAQATLFTLASGTSAAKAYLLGDLTFGLGASLVLGALLEFFIGTPKDDKSETSKFFSGPGNYKSVGETIPVVYGEVFAGSRVISSNFNAVDWERGLKSKQYGTVIDVISEGEIEGLIGGSGGIYLDDTPVRSNQGDLNTEGVVYSMNVGTQHQPKLFTTGIIVSERRDHFVDISEYVSAVANTPIIPDIVIRFPRKDTSGIFGYSGTYTAVGYSSGDFNANMLVGRTVTTTNYFSRARITNVVVSAVKSGPPRADAFRFIIRRGFWYNITFSAKVSFPSSNFGVNADVALVFRVPNQPGNIIEDTGSGINAYGINDSKLPARAVELGYTVGAINFDADIDRDVSDILQSQFIDNEGVYREVGVNTKVSVGTSIIRTVHDKDVDSVRVRIHIPNLSWSGKKGLENYTAPYTIEVREANVANWPATPAVSQKIRGKITSGYDRSHTIPLRGVAPWDIRVTKLAQKNDGNDKAINNIYFSGYTEIKYAKLNYPNTAAIGLSFDSEFYNTVPTRAYHVKGLKIRVPTNYSPTTREYAGVWNGTFKTVYSNNPAWVLYDILVEKRYGLGDYIDESSVDKWGLYEIGKYCDELVDDGHGGTEPRYVINTQIFDARQALSVIRELASIFRGSLFWNGTTIKTFQDRPSDPVYQFTNANVSGGIFSYSGATFTHQKNSIIVTWNNPNNFYRKDYEPIYNDELISEIGTRRTDLVAVGCTSQGQARRLGKWYLYSSGSEQEIVTFNTGLETLVIFPGDIIQIQDRLKLGVRMGGRIKSISEEVIENIKNPRKIVLDSPVELYVGQTYYISISIGDSGLYKREILNIAGNADEVITVDDVIIDAYNSDTDSVEEPGEADSIWAITGTSLVTQLYRVLTVNEADGTAATITALIYNPDKYDTIEKGLLIEYKPSVIGVTPPKPKNLVITEELYITENNEIKNKGIISWDAVPNSYKYIVTWERLNDVGEIFGGEGINGPFRIDDSEYIILDAPAGDYKITVKSVFSFNNKESAAASSVFTLFGKTAPPENVTGLSAKVVPVGLEVIWDVVEDLDVAGYELDFVVHLVGLNRSKLSSKSIKRVGTTNSYILALNYNENLTVTHVDISVRAKDTSNIYSVVPATFTAYVTRSHSILDFTAVINSAQISLSWESAPDTAEYEIRVGEDYSGATLFWRGIGTSVTKEFYNMLDDKYIFWIRGISNFGHTSTVISSVRATVTNDNKNWYVVDTKDFGANNFPDTMGEIAALPRRFGHDNKLLFKANVNSIAGNTTLRQDEFDGTGYFYAFKDYEIVRNRLLLLDYKLKGFVFDALTWENNLSSWGDDINKRQLTFSDTQGSEYTGVSLGLTDINIGPFSNKILLSANFSDFVITKGLGTLKFNSISIMLYNFRKPGAKFVISCITNNQDDNDFFSKYSVIGDLSIYVWVWGRRHILKIPLDFCNINVDFNNDDEVAKYAESDQEFLNSLSRAYTSFFYAYNIYKYPISSYRAYLKYNVDQEVGESKELIVPYISYRKYKEFRHTNGQIGYKDFQLDDEVIDSISFNNDEITSERGVVPTYTRDAIHTITQRKAINDLGFSDYVGPAVGTFIVRGVITYPMLIPREFSVCFSYKNELGSINEDSILTVITSKEEIDYNEIPFEKDNASFDADHPKLIVWRESETGQIHLQDELGNRASVKPVRYRQNDSFFIGISQTKVNRIIVLKNYTGEVVSAELPVDLSGDAQDIVYNRIYVV